MREVKCKKCFRYHHEWCSAVHDSPDPDLIRDCQYFRTKTNADRIRSMTDEELADVISAWILASPKFINRDNAHDGVLNWLKQECES